MDIFSSRVKNFSKQSWILMAIVLVGIFLRSYKFSQWLYFYPDQARDVMIVDNYLNGKIALPLLGFKAASTFFQLGAMYSYFQIISAKLFGISPATVAYPDLIFGSASILLLYYFMKRYFSTNISLALAGLFSVSFYMIRYSRFAWNVNPIPFFIIMFLLAIHEILYNKSKVNRKWVILAGLALGVGVQLHTVLLVSLPIVSVLAFFYTVKLDRAAWRKWAAIFLLALALNTGQIVSEITNKFLNTSYFFSVLNDRSPSEGGGIINSLGLNIVCHSQANVLYLSGLENNDNCDSFSNFEYDKNAKNHLGEYVLTVFSLLFGLLVFIAGYGLLVYFFKKENDEKKKLFLGLNLTYCLLTFFIILPIIAHNGQVRYWLPVAFLPFMFLGLLAKYGSENFPKKYQWLGMVIVLILVVSNFYIISTEARQHAQLARSNAQYVVLGEVKDISAYIESQARADSKNEAFILGGQKYMQNFYKPLLYVLAQHNFSLVRNARDEKAIPEGMSVFFIGQSLDNNQKSKYDSSPDKDLKIESYKSFGNIGIYKIAN